MNLRLAVSLVVVATLAYACGPRTQTNAASAVPLAAPHFALASMGGSNTRSTNARERIVKKESASLTTTFDVAQQDNGVHFALHILNGTGKRVELSFPNGQAYDFVVIDSIGREVWRWADGRIFTQSVQNKLLGKGEAMAIVEKWSPAKAGKYTAIARLHATNFPVEQRVEFERK